MKNLSKAVIQVMQAVKGLEKNSKVGTGNSAYDGTKDKDVKEAFNQALADAGLCILPIEIKPKMTVERWEEADQWSKTTPKAKKIKQSIITEVETKYLLLHDSGESIELSGYGQGIDSQDKGAGKATTYALKNCLLYCFLTPVGKIDDTDTTHSNEIATPPKATLKNPAPVKKENPVALTDVQIESIITKGTQEIALDGIVAGKWTVTSDQMKKLQTLNLK